MQEQLRAGLPPPPPPPPPPPKKGPVLLGRQNPVLSPSGRQNISERSSFQLFFFYKIELGIFVVVVVVVVVVLVNARVGRVKTI